MEPLVQDADIIVHFAAETHVDRSIQSAASFIQTDVIGTFVLLEAARLNTALQRFVQISTDEVYGSVTTGKSRETDALMPRNPYAASKAAADRLAYSYWATYGVPVIVTRASNNYGPYQFPEKLIPLFVTNAIKGDTVPLYGDGLNVRDWLHVEDHCRAIDVLLGVGTNGEIYNIGGGNEVTNLDLTHRILALLKLPTTRIRPVTDRLGHDIVEKILTAVGKPNTLIKKVEDRPGHDRRYALDTTKLRSLGWRPRADISTALEETVDWYRENEWWWRPLTATKVRPRGQLTERQLKRLEEW